MPLQLSRRVAILQPSPTLGITAKAAAMRAAGHDVLSFGAGEPDFDTPEPIRQAAIEALQTGKTRYTPSAGTPQLREAIAAKLLREDGLTYAPSQIVATCGAKQAVYEALQVVLSPGDEALLIAPYWMTYADQVRLAGGEPVVVPTSAVDGFIPDPDRIQAAITSRTRVLIVNSPGNPTGAVIPRAVIEAIVRIAEAHDLWLISDEIYKRLVYGEAIATSLAELAYDRTITVNGASKAFAMTGWRIGFAAAPPEVATAMANLQDQLTSNPTSFAQAGAVLAFANGMDAEVEAMRAEFERRRNLMIGLLNGIEGVSCPTPGGAFYVFPDVSAVLRKHESDAAFAAALLEEAKVAVIPGSVFEGRGHIRLSYATDRSTIERGVARLADFITGRGGGA